MVGAVVVRDGKVVGEGWHERFGEAHAEIRALAAAGEDARGATLYVTLEPCCHHGKTPQCTDAILRAGVARVAAALRDPFPQVAGQGAAQLEQAGVGVTIGLCARESATLNAPYLKLLHTGQPYVHAKWAMSLDGKMATRTGDSKWISNEESRKRVHQLRGRMDGIIVGIGTVLADDPLLTARPPGPRRPTRIVLDLDARLPIASQLVRTVAEAPVLVVTSEQAEPKRVEALRAHGCECLMFATENRVFPNTLLDELGRRRMTNVLVEGGSEVLGGFFDHQAIDEVHVFVAPVLVGGAEAKTPLGGTGVAKMTEACRLGDCQVEILADDVYWNARLK